MPNGIPGSWRGVVNRYRACPPEVQNYFSDLPSLIENYDWEVCLGFMFIQVERALNTMLYCGARKMHKADSDVARRFIEAQYMTRKEFRRLFSNVFGQEIPAAVVAGLVEAEKIRDKVIHGKNATDVDKRKAVVGVLKYAEEMNSLVKGIAGFEPFTDNLRGFAGRGETLDEKTTAWLMKGLGFTSRSPDDTAA
jgi:hypothetical protein